MRIHALWCHPRSVSTAFERIMRERGDLAVLHEPFMYDYYVNGGRNFADFTPEPGHPTDYAGIRDMILNQAREKPVFFKDMAYYVRDTLPTDPDFARAMSHAFLVRDPAEAIVSYHRRDPAFTSEELGHEAQWVLFDALRKLGCDPLVIRSDDLRRDPRGQMTRYWAAAGLPDLPGALTWDNSVPEGWKSVADWHSEVLRSGAIKPPEDRDYRAELSALGPRFAAYDDHHRPFYEALCEVAERQAHQK